MQLSLTGYYGAKGKLHDKYIQLIPTNVMSYVEPFVGSGAIFLNKPRYPKTEEIINDIDENMIRIYRVLQDKDMTKEFIERLIEVECTYENLIEIKKLEDTGYMRIANEVERAVYSYIICHCSFNNARKAFIKEDKSREHSSYFRRKVLDLMRINERLQGVQIYNEDAIKVIENTKDCEGKFLFLDPPYVQSSRVAKSVYTSEMTENDHIRLLESILAKKKSKVLLCGYNSENNLYDNYLIDNGWRKIEVTKAFKYSSVAKGKKPREIEYVWINYELAKHAEYFVRC